MAEICQRGVDGDGGTFVITFLLTMCLYLQKKSIILESDMFELILSRTELYLSVSALLSRRSSHS